jgi:hypothetical protein
MPDATATVTETIVHECLPELTAAALVIIVLLGLAGAAGDTMADGALNIQPDRLSPRLIGGLFFVIWGKHESKPKTRKEGVLLTACIGYHQMSG